jgi:hypothetical protein
LIVPQCDLDKALKDKQNKVYPKGFFVEVVFTMLEADLAEQAAVYETHAEFLATTTTREGQPSIESPRGEVLATRYSDLMYKYPSLACY